MHTHQFFLLSVSAYPPTVSDEAMISRGLRSAQSSPVPSIRPDRPVYWHRSLKEQPLQNTLFSAQSTRAEKQDKGLSIYQIFHRNIIMMIKLRLKLPLGDRPNLFLGPKSFLPFICLSKIALIPAAGRCSEAMARVRPRLLWPRRLRLPRQLAQHPCCCHSACVAQSLILSISPALHMQLALFSMASLRRHCTR